MNSGDLTVGKYTRSLIVVASFMYYMFQNRYLISIKAKVLIVFHYIYIS